MVGTLGRHHGVLTREKRGPKERAAGKIQPDSDAGHTVFRFSGSQRKLCAVVPIACEISDPRTDLRITGVRVLRSGGRLAGASGAAGGAQAVSGG